MTVSLTSGCNPTHEWLDVSKFAMSLRAVNEQLQILFPDEEERYWESLRNLTVVKTEVDDVSDEIVLLKDWGNRLEEPETWTITRTVTIQLEGNIFFPYREEIKGSIKADLEEEAFYWQHPRTPLTTALDEAFDSQKSFELERDESGVIVTALPIIDEDRLYSVQAIVTVCAKRETNSPKELLDDD